MGPASESIHSGGYKPTKFSPPQCERAQKGAFKANKHHHEGLVGATWLPVPLCVLPMSPNHHPTTAQGSPGVVRGHPKIAIFQPIRAGLKKSSLWGPIEGPILETLEIAPGTPAIGWGVHMEENSGTGPGSELTHSGGYRPTKSPPPNPPTIPKKKWHQGLGRLESFKLKKLLGDNFVSQMIMFQGVKHHTPGYAMPIPPKRGGYGALTLALDLTTSVR